MSTEKRFYFFIIESDKKKFNTEKKRLNLEEALTMALERIPLRKDVPRDGSPGKMSKSEEVDHKR